MKELISKIKFAFRYAFRNIFTKPTKSLLMIIGFLALFAALLVGSSMPTYIKEFFYGEYKEKYGNIDLIMDVNPNGTTRFFRTRDLFDESLSEVINDAIPFFEIDLLIKTNGDKKFYAHLFSSNISNFKKISNSKLDSNINLSFDEILITKSMAKTNNLKIDDEITIQSGNLSKVFKIKEIIEDGKHFTNNSIYIDKLVSFSFFLESLSPELANINPSLLNNIHNKVYLDLSSNIAVDDAINTIKLNNDYKDLNYKISINNTYIDSIAKRSTSVFLMIVSIVSFAIILVLYTTLLVYFQDKKKMFAVIETLGGKKRFALLIVIIEILIYYFISLILSIFTTKLILNYGIKYLDSPITYNIRVINVIIVSLILVVLFLITTIIFFNKFNKNALIEQTKESGVEVKSNIKKNFIISVLILMIYLLLSIIDLKYNSPIKIVLTIAFILSFGRFLIQFINLLFNKSNKPKIFSVHLKVLLSKKAFYQYMSVLLISMISIFFLVLANDYMNNRIKKFKNEYNLDFIVTNIIRDFDLTYQEIKEQEEVKNSSKASLFLDVKINEIDDIINSVIYLKPNDINTYFNINISDELKNKLKADEPVILLPYRYEKIFKMEVNDYITLDIDFISENTKFKIGGFFDKQVGNLAFINILDVSEFKDFKPNSIFVNAKDNKDQLNYILLDKYSSKLIYIVDFESRINIQTSDIEKVKNYLIIIIFILLCCFVLSIVNHSNLLLNQMKSIYGRLLVLGYSYKKMVIFELYESILVFLIFIFTTLIGYVMIGVELKDFIILFGEYEKITITLVSFIYGSIIVSILFLVTKAIYIYKIKDIEVSSIIKIY